MTRTWLRPQRLALASMASVGLVTTVVAIATVAVVVSDPVGTADALSARDARPMIDALATLIWRAVTAVVEYL